MFYPLDISATKQHCHSFYSDSQQKKNKF